MALRKRWRDITPEIVPAVMYRSIGKRKDGQK
jgi:hypothetical protein